MTYRGHVKNGLVVLDEPAQLMDGTSVEVQLVDEGAMSETLRDLMMRYSGCIEGLPPDFSEKPTGF
jgi:hypothetical protein